ncbi:Flp pilus assembly protein TadG [Pararobbsia alpina]|uniref:vWA domain-containing protein n=1 Tax=Pararobbsia alpina TaxID=621374 RepID=UPI0039A6CD9A
MKKTSIQRQRGSVSIIVVVSLMALLGVLGLAIDSGMGYMIRTRLDAAADGAAIAAGQAVTRGNTQSQQVANATQAATAFFAANYPTGFLGSTASLSNPSIVFNNGTVTIDIAATASVAPTFMQMFGFKILNVSTSSEAVRKDLDMSFVIDTTGSLNSSGVPAAVRSSAVNFLSNFDVTNDRVALMHFAYGTIVDVPFNGNTRGFDRTTMTKDINAYSFSGSTNSVEAMWNARNQLDTVITQPSSLRVIVFFSDGAPNSFSGLFPAVNTACGKTAGTVSSPDTSGNWGSIASGLYTINAQQTQMSGCYSNTVSNVVTAMPRWYNAHNATDQTLPIWPVTSPRAVPNGTPTQANVNRASRNLLEGMAEQARLEGTYVFTLGYGPYLTQATGPDNEPGANVLKCMANTADSDCYKPSEPVGVYCYAATTADLKPCFSQIASQILRITK